MQRHNWIAQYCNPGRPVGRFDATPEHLRELEDRLQRWDGASSWKRLEQPGVVAQVD